MHDSSVPNGRWRRRAPRVAGMGAAAAALVAGMLMAVIPNASAATLAQESGLTRTQIDAALSYCAAYPDEIAARIELHRRGTAAAEMR